MKSLYCFFMYFRCQSFQEVHSYTPPRCLVSSIFMGFMYSPLINFNFHKKPDENFETTFWSFYSQQSLPTKSTRAGKYVSLPLCQEFVVSPTDDNSSRSRASAVESTETQSKREAFHHRKWNNCLELKAGIKLADHN